MAVGELTRRHPACGSELEHGPHEYTWTCKYDGTELVELDHPRHCSGWTAAEADLCVMLRQVHVTMLEKAPLNATAGVGGRFRLECSPAVVAGLAGLLLGPRRVTEVHGAEVVITMLGEGRWQLSEVSPPLSAGVIRQ